ncbi:MAG TPA: transcription antitermination factor NusB [Caulobacteraceae bacterium]|nr:transcription antitermination factor NusB [Caulobacteraceae bacterium]
MSDRAHRARTVARLAAVQALYQMETAGAGSEAVIREFGEFRFDRDVDDMALAPADEAFFAKLVRGAVEQQARLDRAIRRRLAEGWRLERIDATLRAVLRVGAFELVGGDAPTEVVIDEYVEIAKSFFDGPEAGFVNAALDGIARDERPA